MQFLFLSLFSAAIVALDQYTKYLTVAKIPLFGHVDMMPGFLGLTYVRNTGAAFSSFEGQQWLFALIFIVFTSAVLWEYFKKPMPFTRLERFCIAAIYGGGGHIRAAGGTMNASGPEAAEAEIVSVIISEIEKQGIE